MQIGCKWWQGRKRTEDGGVPKGNQVLRGMYSCNLGREGALAESRNTSWGSTCTLTFSEWSATKLSTGSSQRQRGTTTSAGLSCGNEFQGWDTVVHGTTYLSTLT